MVVKESCTIEDLASLIGKLVSICPATTYGRLYTKRLERQKLLALQAVDQDYTQVTPITKSCKEDMKWWQNNLEKAFFRLDQPDFDLTIFTDASRSGWGAWMGEQHVFGFWDSEETEHHINFLELLAIKLALDQLVGEAKNQKILLRVDNTTAISYINKMGGIQHEKYNILARTIWQWAEERSNFLYATYIKSAENKEADFLSRIKYPDTEWSLDHQTFFRVTKQFGEPQIDLFATKINAKCPCFVSRFPEEEAFEIDAFTLNWSNLQFYAFPPFSMILRTLNKIRRETATGIVIVPEWPSQPWFPLLTSLLVKDPMIFDGSKVNQHFVDRNHHSNIQEMNFIAALVSGNPSSQGKYRRRH